MYIMKKIITLFTLIIFIICQTASVSAYELPRWQFFPVKTYVAEHPKKPIVMRAFKEWENSTNIAKFFYVDTDRKIPKIIVTFEDDNSFTPDSGHAAAVGVTYSFTPRGFYATAKVKIFLHYPGTNIPLPDDQIYAIALHEIGHALGLKHSTDYNTIMYYSVNNSRHLTKKDLDQFFRIYK